MTALTDRYPVGFNYMHPSHWVNKAIGWVNSPELLPGKRFFWKVVRQVSPATRLGSTLIITRFNHACEVLARDDEFSVSSIYAERMIRNSGQFVLCMDGTPQWAREKQLLNTVMPASDVATIRQQVQSHCSQIMQAFDASGCRGEFDVIEQLTRAVPLQLVAGYFGVEGPSRPVLAQWLRDIFYDVFCNYLADKRVSSHAQQAGAALRSFLHKRIQQLRTQLSQGTCDASIHETVLGRLIVQQREHPWIDDDTICRNISGLIVGTVETTNKAAAHAIDELLRHPLWLKQARHVALSGDEKQCREVAFEALRFNPDNPVLARYCEQDVVLSAGSDDELFVKKGTRVLLSHRAALFDPKVYEKPNQFRIDREAPNLYFGHGRHQCQGAGINAVMLPTILSAVVSLEGWQRASKWRGRMVYEGPFPTHLRLVRR